MHTLHIRGRLSLLAPVLALLLACNPFSANDAARADIRGIITQIRPADAPSRQQGLYGVILIEGQVEADTTYDKAAVTITDKTIVLEQLGAPRRPATFDTLKVGDRVQARFTGPVMQSYPAQATASQVMILR